MTKNILALIVSLLLIIIPTFSYSDSDNVIFLQCSLDQRLPFTHPTYDHNIEALKTLPLSKTLNIEFLLYKEKREAFMKIGDSNRWDESSLFVNPDYYGFGSRIAIDHGGFSTDFYIDRRNLAIYTEKVDKFNYSRLNEFWKSLSDEQKIADYGEYPDGIAYFQFFGNCKISAYSEPKI